SWWWVVDTSTSAISSALSSHSARLVDLQSYDFGSGRRYAAVMVSNSGTDAKAWHWYVGQTVSQVSSHLSSDHERLIEANHRSDGLYDVISYSAASPSIYWWWNVNLSSTSQVADIVNQKGARPINVH